MGSTGGTMQPNDNGNDGNGDDRRRGTDNPDEGRAKRALLRNAVVRVQRVMDFLQLSEQMTDQYIEGAADELERLQRCVERAVEMGYDVPPFFLGNLRERFLNMFSYRRRLELKRKREPRGRDKKRCKREDNSNEDEPANDPSGPSGPSDPNGTSAPA